VILITSFAAGAAPLEVGLAVGLSGIRLLPMVVALLPVLRSNTTRMRDLVLPAHFTAVSMWVETLRLAPKIPREQRVAFANGTALGLLMPTLAATTVGYSLAATLPALLVAALLFLTPMSFMTSVTRNSRMLSDRLAIAFGAVLGPLLAWQKIGLDLMWTGLVGGTVAYGLHRLREALR
jgi:hypothetical protein